MKTQDRLNQHLSELNDKYPKAAAFVEMCRRDRGKDLPDWEEWCYAPMAAWYAAICEEMQIERLSLYHAPDIAVLAALGAWRYTKSIYRLNKELYKAIVSTDIKGNLPIELLMRFPEWCVYIETPDLTHEKKQVYGFYTHLEWDANTARTELRLLLDREDGFASVPIHIGNWTVEEGLEKAANEARKNMIANKVPGEIEVNYAEIQAQQLAPFLSLLLYICSDGVEYRASNLPKNPTPKRTKKGWKLFPAPYPRVWNLGDSIGNELKKASETQEKTNDKERKEMRPHIRRAHWHTFYAGAKDKEREVRVN